MYIITRPETFPRPPRVEIGRYAGQQMQFVFCLQATVPTHIYSGPYNIGNII